MTDPNPKDARILIVDDEPANVLLLERILERAGYTQRCTTTDPRQAVTRFAETAPDLVLLDLHMPHLDGFAVMEALATVIGPDELVPVVVLTADSTAEVRQRALAAGANDFLTKPFDATEVLLRIQNLLHTRTLHVRLHEHNRALEAKVRAHDEAERRLAMEHLVRRRRIEQVLEGSLWTMVFQPIVHLATGRVTGAEALARFSVEPDQGPDRWFADAAAVGLGLELELAAVQTALGELDQLPDAVYLSLNVSADTATSPALLDVLHDVASQRLVLELTEHARVDDYASLRAAIDPLRERGVRLAVDDAGAGFASLNHILCLDPDIIKLDVVFTHGIDRDPVRRALAASLVGFGREIDACILAEGVETAAEFETLRALGVDHAQGYYLARPGPLPMSVVLLDHLAAPRGAPSRTDG
jgi:EAL domain-containing protein (putative c-di-GMP-specific phosphodiesterase class I)/CheY-like chemotaxis protein